MCAGLIIPGSIICIEPTYYGDKPFKVPNEVDEYKLDSELIYEFSKLKKPILGICGGMQALNVFFGGTLKRGVLNHNETEHSIKVIDKFTVNNKEYFSFWNYIDNDVIDNKKNMIVNSYHIQAIDKLAYNMHVVALSNDNIIEAIQSTDGNVIGIEWHPEIRKTEPDYNILNYFMKLCKYKNHNNKVVSLN